MSLWIAIFPADVIKSRIQVLILLYTHFIKVSVHNLLSYWWFLSVLQKLFVCVKKMSEDYQIIE